MRRTNAGLALIVTGVLLTGCGGEDGGGEAGEGPAPSAAQSERTENEGDGGSDGTEGGEVTREVTLEVEGEGRTQVAYVAGTNGTEQVTLPWSRTVEIGLTEAERKAGVLVSVVPGSVPGDDGMFKPATCVIKVDGEKVADNRGGRDVTGCEHLLK